MKIRRGVHLLLLLVSSLFSLLILLVYLLDLDFGAPAGAEAAVARSLQPAGISSIGVQAWQTEIIDMPGYFDHMSDRSLRFDSAGNLHMVYGGDRLYYAKSDGETWQVQIVDPGIGTGMGASLDLDSADRPHISYLDLPNVDLKYAHWDGESWEFQVVDMAYPYQERTSIAIDSADQPHIAYRKMEWLPPDYSCPGMGHAHWNGSEWQIDRFNDCGSFASLALDSADKPHITFYDGGIKYATNLTGTWTIDSVGSSSYGYGSSVAVDSQDRPHVVYVDDEGSAQLIYAYWDGSNWISSVVGSSNGGLNLSLTLGVSDTVHIADGADYIVLNGNTQQDISNPTYNEGSSFSSIAVDSAGRPAISYLGFGSRMYCKHWDEAEWVTDLVDDGGNSGWLNSMALDSGGEPHISYYGSYGGGGGAIKHAFRSGEVWTSEIITATYVPSVLHSGYHTSLALDSNDIPHASFWYSEFYTDGLYYGYQDGEAWQIEMIADDTDAPSTLVLDSTDRAHVAFVDNGILKYGSRTDYEWAIQEIVTGSVTTVAGLVLDTADDPRILYVASSNGTRILNYAALIGDAWEVDEVVEAGAGNWVEAALTLGSSEKPHIAYIETSDDQSVLKYAKKNGEVWEVESVDSRRWSIGGPSILLDEADNPVIVFSYYPGFILASRSGDSWNIEQVFDIRGRVNDLEAAANDAGELFISYYDSRGHGLVLAGPKELPEHLYLPAILK